MIQHKLALIALGANLPSATASAGETLNMAACILHEKQNTTISACSRFWKTPAFPTESGPDFINGAIVLRTILSPHELLARLHEIEKQFGRDRSTGRWSSRVLDLDLIGYENLILPEPETHREWVRMSAERQLTDTPDTLILPHPRLQDRGFVLAPLAEIAPDWVHPATGLSIAEMLAALPASALAGMTPFGLQETPVST